MTTTAVGLNDYYTALESSISDTISLYELDSAISQISLTDDQRGAPEKVRASIEDRRQLAAALAKLAVSMSFLSRSTAASDVATSAKNLGNELITIKALPGGSPVPDAMGKAGNLLLQVIQQHEEKKAARAVDGTLSAIAELFEREKPVYDSIERTRLREASQVAEDLIRANAVDPTPMLVPALKPFDLVPLPPKPALQASLRTLALARLNRATDDANKRAEAASSAMLDALQEMTKRIHLLANEKAMPFRGNPMSIKTVEDWAQSWAASLI